MTPPQTRRRALRGPAALVAIAALTACSDGSFQASTNNGETLVAFALTPGDPLEAQRVLGMRLFFDEHLSVPQGVSCGMCHNPARGWGDGRPQGKGVQDHSLAGDVTGDGVQDHESTLAVQGNFFKTILTPRNTPTIYNASLFPETFWDGRAGELTHQARFPLEEAFEMNSSWADHALPTIAQDAISMELWRTAYGDDVLTVDRAAEAIGVYEASISAFDTPYDAFLAGDTNAFTPEEQLGHDL
ncbi:MAG: cytochrome-c peroxidase, partial [Planctomycetota bacterium]